MKERTKNGRTKNGLTKRRLTKRLRKTKKGGCGCNGVKKTLINL